MIVSPACLTLGLALMCLAAPAFADVKKTPRTIETDLAAGSAAPWSDAGERPSIDDDARKADPCGPDCSSARTRLAVKLPDNFGDGGVGAGVSGDLSSTRIYLVPGSGGSGFVRARRPAFRGVCDCR